MARLRRGLAQLGTEGAMVRLMLLIAATAAVHHRCITRAALGALLQHDATEQKPYGLAKSSTSSGGAAKNPA